MNDNDSSSSSDLDDDSSEFQKSDISPTEKFEATGDFSNPFETQQKNATTEYTDQSCKAKQPLPPAGKRMQHKGKRPWTEDEDKILLDYVAEHGAGNWRNVQKVTGLNRNAQSCRLRWTSHLDPNVNKAPFTEEEDEKLLGLISWDADIKWVAIAMQHFPTRTGYQLQTRWHVLMNRQHKRLIEQGLIPEDPPTISLPRPSSFTSVLSSGFSPTTPSPNATHILPLSRFSQILGSPKLSPSPSKRSKSEQKPVWTLSPLSRPKQNNHPPVWASKSSMAPLPPWISKSEERDRVTGSDLGSEPPSMAAPGLGNDPNLNANGKEHEGICARDSNDAKQRNMKELERIRIGLGKCASAVVEEKPPGNDHFFCPRKDSHDRKWMENDSSKAAVHDSLPFLEEKAPSAHTESHEKRWKDSQEICSVKSAPLPKPNFSSLFMNSIKVSSKNPLSSPNCAKDMMNEEEPISKSRELLDLNVSHEVMHRTDRDLSVSSGEKGIFLSGLKRKRDLLHAETGCKVEEGEEVEVEKVLKREIVLQDVGHGSPSMPPSSSTLLLTLPCKGYHLGAKEKKDAKDDKTEMNLLFGFSSDALSSCSTSHSKVDLKLNLVEADVKLDRDMVCDSNGRGHESGQPVSNVVHEQRHQTLKHLWRDEMVVGVQSVDKLEPDNGPNLELRLQLPGMENL